MTTTATTNGIHHVTMIAGDPQRNLDFYVGALGLRLVKRTVNFDDPHTYHFYFGDEAGTPGSLLTFFPWPTARPGRAGVGQVGVVSLAIAPASLGWWIQRLISSGIPYEGPSKRGDEQVISLRDPDGLLVELVAHASAESRPVWSAGSVPAEHGIHGVHSVSIWAERADPTLETLAALGFRKEAERDGVTRMAAGDGGSGALVDVRHVGGFLSGLGGAGTVHHVAFRAADDKAELDMRGIVRGLGLSPTPQIDRNYFRSVYFREPGGVLFELATDGPGFAIDEPASALGEALKLPPQYESQRREIDSTLPPIELPGKQEAKFV
jgi:glyoxalase family protein